MIAERFACPTERIVKQNRSRFPKIRGKSKLWEGTHVYVPGLCKLYCSCGTLHGYGAGAGWRCINNTTHSLRGSRSATAPERGGDASPTHALSEWLPDGYGSGAECVVFIH